jgi:selenocysteine lyase/cysteine desulfurase
MKVVGANPGRAAHRRAVDAGRIVYGAREAMCDLFHAPDPLRVVFGANATEGLNLALRGLLRPGDHAVTSSMEHNSVMRPLRALERDGVHVTVVDCSPQGVLDPGDVEAALRPNTRLVALNHASNVAGTLLPVPEVGATCRERGLLLLVDAAQTGGAYPIDMQADHIDLLAFSGHKSLGGPMGTGGLILGERVDEKQIEPLTHGGTGSDSEYEVQPDFLPDRCESGTLNAVGLAGLEVGVRWVFERGLEAIRAHEVALTQALIEGLRSIPSTGFAEHPERPQGVLSEASGRSVRTEQCSGVTVYGTLDPELQTATVSFNIAGMAPSEVGLRLDDEYGIMCRVGLHCAPTAHKTIGTFPTGTVRFGLGAFNTMDEVEAALFAVEELAREAR